MGVGIDIDPTAFDPPPEPAVDADSLPERELAKLSEALDAHVYGPLKVSRAATRTCSTYYLVGGTLSDGCTQSVQPVLDTPTLRSSTQHRPVHSTQCFVRCRRRCSVRSPDGC